VVSLHNKRRETNLQYIKLFEHNGRIKKRKLPTSLAFLGKTKNNTNEIAQQSDDDICDDIDNEDILLTRSPLPNIDRTLGN